MVKHRIARAEEEYVAHGLDGVSLPKIVVVRLHHSSWKCLRGNTVSSSVEPAQDDRKPMGVMDNWL